MRILFFLFFLLAGCGGNHSTAVLDEVPKFNLSHNGVKVDEFFIELNRDGSSKNEISVVDGNSVSSLESRLYCSGSVFEGKVLSKTSVFSFNSDHFPDLAKIPAQVVDCELEVVIFNDQGSSRKQTWPAFLEFDSLLSVIIKTSYVDEASGYMPFDTPVTFHETHIINPHELPVTIKYDPPQWGHWTKIWFSESVSCGKWGGFPFGDFPVEHLIVQKGPKKPMIYPAVRINDGLAWHLGPKEELSIRLVGKTPKPNGQVSVGVLEARGQVMTLVKGPQFLQNKAFGNSKDYSLIPAEKILIPKTPFGFCQDASFVFSDHY